MSARPPESAELERLLEVAAGVGGGVPYIEDLGPGGVIVPVFDIPSTTLHPGFVSVTGADWDETIHPDDRGHYADLRAAMRAGGDFAADYRITVADGTVIWVRERGWAQVLEAGWVRVYGTLQDVSAEIESVATIRRIGETIDEYYFTDELRPDGSYESIFATSAMYTLLGGIPAGMSEGEAWRAAVHPDDRAVHDRLEREVRRGAAIVGEYRLCGYDGRTRWVRVRSKVRERRPDGILVLDGVVEEITRRHEMEEELRSRELLLREVAEAIDEALYTDTVLQTGEVVAGFTSPAWLRLAGVSSGIEEPPEWRSLVVAEDRGRLDEYDRGIRACRPTDIEYRVLGLDGVVRWIRDRARPHRRLDGTILVAGVLIDITAEKEASQRLAVAYQESERSRREADRLAHTDVLTGAFNRRHLLDAARRELDRGRRNGASTGLLVIDLDHFKLINDLQGHAAGDEALRLVADRLTESLRLYDVLARIGGEEFVVLLPGSGGGAELMAAAERVRRIVEDRPFPVLGEELAITVSIGAAVAGPGELALEQLLDHADRALYAAKFGGRNRSVLYEDARNDDAPNELVVVRLARTFAIAAAAREGMPPNHLQDVAELSARVASELRLSSLDAVRCRLAGWLHDVGKVAVPDTILVKAGPLSAEEWAVMREHTVLGESLVLQVPELADAAPAVRHHHEHFDGSGYPDGLRGEEIPLAARIVAVVDAYSAMTTHRVYSAARTPDEAISELRRCAGAHFDPAVVEAFVRTLAAAVPLAAD